MATSTETRLVSKLKAGDEAAYAEFIDNYGGVMLSVARRYMRDEDNARDCFQDACLQVFRAIDKFEHRSTLKTWAHRITVNACLMSLRKQSRTDKRNVEFDETAPQFDSYGFRIEPQWDLGESAESLVENEKTRQFVLNAINNMSHDYRNILLLRDIEEYSIKETAQLLDVSEDVVKIRLHRARAALKRALEPLFRPDALIGGKGD